MKLSPTLEAGVSCPLHRKSFRVEEGGLLSFDEFISNLPATSAQNRWSSPILLLLLAYAICRYVRFWESKTFQFISRLCSV